MNSPYVKWAANTKRACRDSQDWPISVLFNCAAVSLLSRRALRAIVLGTAELAISCSDLDWERSREIAERRGVSINEDMISAGLSVELDLEALSGPSLVLTEKEQRQLFDRVVRMADSTLAAVARAGIPSSGFGNRWSCCS